MIKDRDGSTEDGDEIDKGNDGGNDGNDRNDGSGENSENKGHEEIEDEDLYLSENYPIGDLAQFKAKIQSNNITKLELFEFTETKAVLDILQSGTYITNLKLNYCNLHDEGAAAVATVLQSNSSITNLSVFDDTISLAGWKTIFNSLQSITVLELYKFDEVVLKELADTLESNSTLQTLILRSNPIGSKGAAIIAKSLASNTSITTVELQLHGNTDKGVTEISKFLASNTSLVYVYLCMYAQILLFYLFIFTTVHNGISDIGIKSISNFIRVNKSVKELYFSHFFCM